ncbi:MAG TPA: tyrosine--tRNA ligase [Actinomycetota bacterium]|nr:tyrosine--tRNA ligase [Actinomycetota bacterium]
MAPMDPKEQLERLTANAAEVVPRDEFRAKLERSIAEGRPLRAKLGIDPSRPDLTLGHTVVLRKLRQFQDLGHTAVLIIGDFTGLVGDPSGQSETRPMLTPEDMESNARTYFEQAGLVLDMAQAEIRHNSEWLGALTMTDILRLTATTTVAQMLERDDFHERYRDGRPISIVEFLYPLMQGMDSVAVEADVELGGTDQTFNLLMGREIQRAYGVEPQVVLTMPLLIGTDGQKKMSKSLDNYVALTESPDEMFGKLMSIPDELIASYVALLTDHDLEQLRAIQERVESGGSEAAEAKRRLAREIVAAYHGEGEGRAAEERFDQVHKRRETPEDVPEFAVREADVFSESKGGGISLNVPALLVQLGLAESRSEARRLMAQEGVRADGKVVTPELERWTIDPQELLGQVWQVGRRRFARVSELT